MKRRLFSMMPRSLRPVLQKLYYLPGDLLGMVTQPDSMVPPKSKIFIGSGDFLRIGEDFRQYFIDLGGLQPHHRVLDVGCGIGRMAIPLTEYLSGDGEYWGLDIVKEGIDWCQKRITPRFGNFHFLHSDIYNKEYNRSGKTLAKDFQFPFEDGYVDFVFLTSVFTHMLPPDVENYMSEIARVLKTGGMCLITFFVLNSESMELVRSGTSSVDFKYDLGGCFTSDEKVPETAIAYDEEAVRNLFHKNGLTIRGDIHYGSWCRRPEFLTYQDLIVAEKSN